VIDLFQQRGKRDMAIEIQVRLLYSITTDVGRNTTELGRITTEVEKITTELGKLLQNWVVLVRLKRFCSNFRTPDIRC